MATLYVTEYPVVEPLVYAQKLGPRNTGTQFALPPAAQSPKTAENNVAISGASAASAAFNAKTLLVRVHTDAICSVEVGGSAPVATTASARMIAGQTEYFLVKPGDKLAVIANT